MKTETETGGKYCYRYPRASLTADCVIFGFNGRELKILLVERGNEPFFGYWALPGGFMKMNETIEQAAARELKEETNLSKVFLDQFRVYSDPKRDPRERVVTVAFIALVKPEDYRVAAGDDAAKAMWFDLDMLPPLAFDHKRIVDDAREHLKEILRLKPVAFELLNEVFTISELQTIYEVIDGTTYDRRNFLRTAIDSELIEEVDVPQDDVCCACDCAPEPYCAPPMMFDCSPGQGRSHVRSPGRTPKLYTFTERRRGDSIAGEEKECEAPYTRSKAPTKGLFDLLKKTTRKK